MPFMKGFNNPKYHDEVIASTKKMIDACADAGVPRVIAFTGYKWRDAEDPKSGEIRRDEGADNCVGGLQEDHRLRREEGRDDLHGAPQHARQLASDEGPSRLPGRRRRLDGRHHPQGRLAAAEAAVRHLPRADHARRHASAASSRTRTSSATSTRPAIPAAASWTTTQEIQYPPIMRKLLEIGYTGYVGQEFIPTRDPLEGLRQAVRLCDV